MKKKTKTQGLDKFLCIAFLLNSNKLKSKQLVCSFLSLSSENIRNLFVKSFFPKGNSIAIYFEENIRKQSPISWIELRQDFVYWKSQKTGFWYLDIFSVAV